MFCTGSAHGAQVNRLGPKVLAPAAGLGSAGRHIATRPPSRGLRSHKRCVLSSPCSKGQKGPRAKNEGPSKGQARAKQGPSKGQEGPRRAKKGQEGPRRAKTQCRQFCCESQSFTAGSLGRPLMPFVLLRVRVFPRRGALGSPSAVFGLVMLADENTVAGTRL